MADRHVSDEQIIGYLDRTVSAPVDRPALEAHLGRCPSCRRRYDEYREVIRLLSDPRSYERPRQPDHGPGLTSSEAFDTFLAAMHQEDALAHRLLASLAAADDPRAWWDLLARTTPVRPTAGLVRAVIDRTHATIEHAPPRAFALAMLATDLADRLDPAAYPSSVVLQLRGLAWKERASALRYLGRFPEALEAIQTAERCFARTVVPDYDLACAHYVHAYILLAFDEWDTARTMFQRCGKVFRGFGDRQRELHARLMEGTVLYHRHHVPAARTLWRELLDLARTEDDLPTVARLLSNLGLCEADLGDAERAGSYYLQAIDLYEALGMATEKVRIRWSLASLLVRTGRVPEGLARLDATQADFEAFGMTGEAAVVALELVDTLLGLGRGAEVATRCRALVDHFTRIGMTANALAALAFLHESEREGRLTPALLRHVRTYLERLPTEPHLLFAPPPP